MHRPIILKSDNEYMWLVEEHNSNKKAQTFQQDICGQTESSLEIPTRNVCLLSINIILIP